MAAKKKRKKYPGPWKEVSKEFTGRYEVRSTRQGPFNVCAVYQIRYRQQTGPNTYHEERSETRGYDLNHVLRELGIEDRSYALITLASGAFETIEKLFGQYQWKLEKDAIKEAERRKAASQKKKRGLELDERRTSRKFTRVVEA